MTWIAETNNGNFEAANLEALKENMANYFAENHESTQDVISLCYEDAWGNLSIVSDEGINQFIDEMVSCFNLFVEEDRVEKEHVKNLISAYKASRF